MGFCRDIFKEGKMVIYYRMGKMVIRPAKE